jgi:uncharacterized protein YerC
MQEVQFKEDSDNDKDNKFFIFFEDLMKFNEIIRSLIDKWQMTKELYTEV